MRVEYSGTGVRGDTGPQPHGPGTFSLFFSFFWLIALAGSHGRLLGQVQHEMHRKEELKSKPTLQARGRGAGGEIRIGCNFRTLEQFVKRLETLLVRKFKYDSNTERSNQDEVNSQGHPHVTSKFFSF